MQVKICQIILICSVLILNFCKQDFSDQEAMERANKIHLELLTIDSHTDTPLRFFSRGTDLGTLSDSREGGGKLDFPRMEEGGLDGVFIAAFLGQGERTAIANENVKQRTLKLLDSVHAVDDAFPPNLANVSQYCDHVDHVTELIGVEHVGFGSDFDGGAGLEDCYDVTELSNITLELLKRGYSRSDLQKFWSGNLLRVMKEVEETAASL